MARNTNTNRYNNMAHPDWGSVDNRLTRKTPASYRCFKKKGTGAFQKKAQVLLNDNKGTGAFERQRQNQELIKVDIIHYCIKFKFEKTENYIISDGTYAMDLSN